MCKISTALSIGLATTVVVVGVVVYFETQFHDVAKICESNYAILEDMQDFFQRD